MQQIYSKREIQILNDIGNIKEILHIVNDNIAELFNDTDKENIYQVRKLTWVSNSQILKLKHRGLSVWSIHMEGSYMNLKLSRSVKN